MTILNADIRHVAVDHLERANAHRDEQDCLKQLEQPDQPNEPSIVGCHVRIIINESAQTAETGRSAITEVANVGRAQNGDP